MSLLSLAWVLACGDDASPSPADGDGDGTAAGADCDDDDGAVHPGADERCNERDDDCDGVVDEDAADAIAVYTDADGDGYGAVAAGRACRPTAGVSTTGGDCDDADPGAHPGALEICNGGIDDDCDGAVDYADDPAGMTNWYADLDHDGFGGDVAVEACEAPPQHLADHSDCDDDDADVHPGAFEICNDADDDCDAATPETGMVAVNGVPYDSIQAGIDAADPFDTVEICAGTFLENVAIDRSVTLRGRGAGASIVDGRESGPVVSVTHRGVVLELVGLTLQHGVGVPIDSYYCTGTSAGGAVEASQAARLDVDGCSIEHNQAGCGAGIFGPESGSVSIVDTAIHDNEAIQYGGGAMLFHDGSAATSVDIASSQITANLAADGGGVAVFGIGSSADTFSASFSDSELDGNVATNVGGGLYFSWVTQVTLAGVTVADNTAFNAGGVFSGSATSVVADPDTEIVGNIADYGGGIVTYAGWHHGRVADNTAAWEGGGIVSFSGEIRDLVVENNTATYGGGLYLPYESAVYDTQVVGNTADVAGGIYFYGGPHGEWDTATIDGCTVTGNIATEKAGGAIVQKIGLVSTATDWGSGKSDNAPDDIVFDYDYVDSTAEITYTDFGASTDFECVVRDETCE